MVNKRNKKTIPQPLPWTPPTLKPKRKGVIVDQNHYAKVQLSRQAYLRLMNDIENMDLINQIEIDTFQEQCKKAFEEPIHGTYYYERLARKKMKKRAWSVLWIFIGIVVVYCLVNNL